MTNAEWEELKRDYYQSNTIVTTENGTIDFSVEGYHGTEMNGAKVSYDEYLDIQRFSESRRAWFESCFYNGGGADCKGQIERVNKNKNLILFKRIFVRGMYGDGTFFDGKEDHVWMSNEGFEKYKAGDCLSFCVEVYRYLKTRDGKKFDFAVRNPFAIEVIDSYELPSDDDLLKQELEEIVCETCMFAEHCYGGFCIAAPGWREERIQQLFEMVKHDHRSGSSPSST